MESLKLKVESIKRFKSEKWRVKNLHIQLWNNLFNVDFDTSPLSTLQSTLFKKAFTLAEVLITLAIIGVVAAITMPTLIDNMNNRQYISAMKKTYSLLSQATTSIIGEYGSMKNLCSEKDNVCIRNIYKNYLKTVKECDSGNINGNCWSGDWKRLNGNVVWDLDYEGYKHTASILSDGTAVVYQYASPNCDLLDGEIMTCGNFKIDVNGLKGPNKWGKDIYGFRILENKLIPDGSPNLSTDPNVNDNHACDNNHDGFACAYEYLTNQK